MGFFDKTRYLRAIFILLPIGIILTRFGIDGLTTTVEDLNKVKGVVSKYKIDYKYYDYCECDRRTLFVYISEKNKPFITTITENIKILDSFLNKGDSIEIWTWDKLRKNEIKQVKLNGKLVLQYEKLIGINLIFLVIGLGLTVLCVFYIIKSPEDLFGKKKK
jgi:hypothetical protein